MTRDSENAPADSNSTWVAEEPDGTILVRIHAKPRSSRNRVVGISPCGLWLDVAIAAPPVEGEANEALIDFLHKRLKIKKSAITLVRGDAARYKTIRLEGITLKDIKFLIHESDKKGKAREKNRAPN